MDYLLLWIGCGVFSAIIAGSKGRSFGGWLVLGMIFGVFALLAAGFMPKVEEQNDAPEVPVETDKEERKCPFCAEMIKTEAIVCKHCGRDVEPLPKESPQEVTAEDKPA